MNYEALNKQVKHVEALNNTTGSYDRAKHLVNEVLAGVSDSIQTTLRKRGHRMRRLRLLPCWGKQGWGLIAFSGIEIKCKGQIQTNFLERR